MLKKVLKAAGFIALSIVIFNLYVLFDKTFITHTMFRFEFLSNIVQPAFLASCIAVVYAFTKINKEKSKDN